MIDSFYVPRNSLIKPEQTLPDQSKETREQSIERLAVIDDDEKVSVLLRRVLSGVTERPLLVTGYTRATEALTALDDAKDQPDVQPQVVLVDGNLLLDSGALKSGIEVVKRIRALPEYKDILIIGISGTPEINQEMITAGANAAFDKPDVNKVRAYLFPKKL